MVEQCQALHGNRSLKRSEVGKIELWDKLSSMRPSLKNITSGAGMYFRKTGICVRQDWRNHCRSKCKVGLKLLVKKESIRATPVFFVEELSKPTQPDQVTKRGKEHSDMEEWWIFQMNCAIVYVTSDLQVSYYRRTFSFAVVWNTKEPNLYFSRL